jgi:hypothetical protein
MPIISFGSHLDSDLLDSARRAGAVALPRSRFDREFATLLSKISVGVLTTPLQSPPSQETSE